MAKLEFEGRSIALEIVKEMLVKDLKESNSIGNIFQFFTSNQKDIEKGEKAEKLYKELGWHENAYDVISSFWTTFSFAMHSKYPEFYPIAEVGNVKIYKNHNVRFNLESFPERYFKENSVERTRVDCLCEKYPDISKLAKLCHSVANFMPCPKGFNSSKGLLSDVNDYFPLMIDRIQECFNKDTGLIYSNNQIVIDKETIKVWHDFFIKNREKYCLNMYYEVNDKTIKGMPFFDTQSLTYPCPKDSSELQQCLKNMIECIEDRANQIFEKYSEYSTKR